MSKSYNVKEVFDSLDAYWSECPNGAISLNVDYIEKTEYDAIKKELIIKALQEGKLSTIENLVVSLLAKSTQCWRF